jgi:hypothetical protein
VPTPSPGCVFSGTFRCDITLWCFEEIQLGNVTYTKEQAFQILQVANVTHDALLRLTKNLIQTQLNVMCHNSLRDCIEGTIADANFIIGDHISPPFGELGQLPPGTGYLLATIMHAYNGGQQCAQACEDQDVTCPDP